MRILMMYPWIVITILVFLALLLLLCLLRAVKGPSIADRLVAVNMMGTMVMVIIAVLALFMNESYLLDISLIYAMISFLAVVVLAKVYTGVYLEHLAKEEKRRKKKEQKPAYETQEEKGESES